MDPINLYLKESMSQTQEDQKTSLCLKLNGVNVDPKYDLTVEKIDLAKSKIPKGSKEVILEEDYLIVPLSQEKSSDPLFVKISKIELKNKLRLSESEISQINEKNFERILSNKIEKQLRDDKRSSKDLITNFLRAIYCCFVVSPTIQKVLKKELKKIPVEELESYYTEKTGILRQKAIVAILKNNEKAIDYFGNEMIGALVDACLVERVNKRLKHEKKDIWDEFKLSRLNEKRYLFEMKNNPDDISVEEFFHQIPIKSVPLKLLSEIPVTDKNKESLQKIWKQIFTELYEKGSLQNMEVLKNPRDQQLQAYYGGLFLEAFEAVPKELDLDLEKSLKNFRGNNHIEDIKSLLIRNDQLKFQGLEDQQRIYREKIRPVILERIPQFFSNLDAQVYLKIYLEIDDFRYTIFKIQDQIDNVMLVNDKLKFDRNKIRKLILSELESCLIINHGLNNYQLHRLREFEKKRTELKEDLYSFEKDIKETSDLNDLIKLFKSEKSLDLIHTQINLRELETIDGQIKFLKQKLMKKKLKIIEKQAPDSDFKKSIKDSIKILKSNIRTEKKEIFLMSELNQNNKRMNGCINDVFFKDNIEQKNKINEDILGLTNDLYSNLIDIENFISIKKFNLITSQNNNNLKNIDQIKISEDETKRIHNILSNIKKDKEKFEKLSQMDSSNKISGINELILSYSGFGAKFVRKLLLNSERPRNNEKIPVGISRDTVDFVITYIKRIEKFESLSIQRFEVIEAKAKNILEKYRKNQEIKKEERLSLKDLGYLDYIRKLYNPRYKIDGLKDWNFLSELKLLGLSNQNLEFTFSRIDGLVSQLGRVVQNSVNQSYETGDIFASNRFKIENLKDRSLGNSEKIQGFVSNNLMHGGKFYKEKQIIKASHHTQCVVVEELNLFELCTLDVWKIDLKPLFSSNTATYMEKYLGGNWMESVKVRYQGIENSLQEKAPVKFKPLENDLIRIFEAGAANYSTLLHLVGRDDIKGHERDYERDFDELHEKFMSENEISGEQICSEFTSKITLVSMIELNKQLAKELLEKLGDRFNSKTILNDLKLKNVELTNEVKLYALGVRLYGKDREKTVKAENAWKKILEEQGYSKNEIEMVIRIGNEEIMDLPYSRKERLRAIHPGRMVQLLVDKKCAVKRELPLAMREMFIIE